MARNSSATQTRTSTRKDPSSSSLSSRRRAPTRRSARPRTSTRGNTSGRASRTRGNTPERTSRRASRDEAAIHAFFDDFSSALTSGDGDAAAASFEYPALMVMSTTPQYGGNQLLVDTETVADFFSTAPEQYHAKGIAQTFPDIQDVQWVAHDLALVKAHFPYIDDDGNDMGDGETSLYVVRKTGANYAICAAITLGVDSEVEGQKRTTRGGRGAGSRSTSRSTT